MILLHQAFLMITLDLLAKACCDASDPHQTSSVYLSISVARFNPPI
jgi:hypothetical protein